MLLYLKKQKKAYLGDYDDKWEGMETEIIELVNYLKRSVFGSRYFYVYKWIFTIFNYVLDTPSRHNQIKICFCSRLFVSLSKPYFYYFI